MAIFYITKVFIAALLKVLKRKKVKQSYFDRMLDNGEVLGV